MRRSVVVHIPGIHTSHERQPMKRAIKEGNEQYFEVADCGIVSESKVVGIDKNVVLRPITPKYRKYITKLNTVRNEMVIMRYLLL